MSTEIPVLTDSHLAPLPAIINKDNKIIEHGELNPLDKQTKVINELQSIFNAGYTPENGIKLIHLVQKQRSILLEIMMEALLRRPDAKMADSINTTLAQIEKSVRDERKEAMNNKAMETNKETFDLFRKSLIEVSSGRLTMPTFGKKSFNLDPLTSFLPKEEAKIKPEELVQGVQILDIKPIEQQVLANQTLVKDAPQPIVPTQEPTTTTPAGKK